MDALVEFLPILFILAYYLLAGRRRAQQKKAARERDPVPQVATSEKRGATPFQSFLEQLEEAMAEASGQPAAEVMPDPTPVPAAEPVPESRLERIEFAAPAGSFEGPTAVDHEAHGFGFENPLSEEAFEQAPAFSVASRRATPEYDPHGLETSAASRAQGVWQQRLSDPKAAQDAFVLQTVFGGRGGRRPTR